MDDVPHHEPKAEPKCKIPLTLKLRRVPEDSLQRLFSEHPLRVTKDRLKGWLLGVALGDALGVPTEFRNTTPKMIYNGLIPDHAFKIRFRFTQKEVAPGSISDDTEMTLALLRGLLSQGMQYDRNTIISSYIVWANQSQNLGRNTRRLFKGIKTIRGYEGRMTRIDATEKKEMQSNGSLMRASPLALIKDPEECLKVIKEDTYVTNPNCVNHEIGMLYIMILRRILSGATKENVKHLIDNYQSQSTVIRQLLSDLRTDSEREVCGKVKGWVCSAFYIAIKAFLMNLDFQESMDWIIGQHPGSDTDTNGAIGGALLGAYHGYEQMMQESRTQVNHQRLMQYCQTANKAEDYLLLDLETLVDHIFALLN